MKKLIAKILILSAILSLCVPVYAADSGEMRSVSEYWDTIYDQKYVPLYHGENITIDGDSSDWDGDIKQIDLVYRQDYLSKTNDTLKAWYKCAYDDEYFYFVLESEDNKLTGEAGSLFWASDCIQFILGPLDSYGKRLGMCYDVKTDKPYFGGDLTEKDLPGMSYDIKRDGNKLTYECALKWTDLFEEKPLIANFAIVVADNDGNGREYVLETEGGGIAEGFTNHYFPKMIQMEPGSACFMWLKGDNAIKDGENANFELHIYNEDAENVLNVKIPGLEYEKTIKLDKGTYYVEKITKKFDTYGEYDLAIECDGVEGKYSFVATVHPTEETFATNIAQVKKYVSELKELIDKCSEQGIPTDYEVINLTVLEHYVDYIIPEDIENNNTSRYKDYLWRVLKNIYVEARENLIAYLQGAKKANAVPRYIITENGSEYKEDQIWADTITDGVIEKRPIFRIGYGHFEDAAQFSNIFDELGMSYLNMEKGPRWSMVKAGSVQDWIGGRCDETSKIYQTRDEAYEGEKSLHVIWNGGGYNTINNTVFVEKGETYEYGCYVKGDFSSAWISGNAWNDHKNLPSHTDEWTELKFEKVADGPMILVRLLVEGVSDGYVDNFFVRKKGTTENLVYNGDFENEYNPEQDYTTNLESYNLMAAYFEKAQENNIACGLLLSPHYYISDVMIKYGAGAKAPGPMGFDVTHPEVLEYLEDYIAKTCYFANSFPCVTDIILSNEPCYETSQNEYFYDDWVAFLKEKYGTIEELNSEYNREYTDFTEVKMPTAPEKTPENDDYRDFNEMVFSTFHEWMAKEVKKHLPDMPVHIKNMEGTMRAGTPSKTYLRMINHGINQEEFIKFTDFAGFDGGDSFGGGSFTVTEFSGTELEEDIGDFVGPFHLAHNIVVEMNASFTNKPIYNTEDHLITDGSANYIDENAMHVGRYIWNEAVLGMSGSAIWLFSNSYTDHARKGSIQTRPDAILEAGRSSLDLNRLAYEVYALRDAPRNIGILYSDTNIGWNYESRDCYKYIYAGAVYGGEPPLFVSENQLEKLDGLKAVFVPWITHAPERVLDATIDYLDKGGRVIVYGEDSFMYDEKGKPHNSEKIQSIMSRSEIYQETRGYSETQYVIEQKYYPQIIDVVKNVIEEENLDDVL